MNYYQTGCVRYDRRNKDVDKDMIACMRRFDTVSSTWMHYCEAGNTQETWM